MRHKKNAITLILVSLILGSTILASDTLVYPIKQISGYGVFIPSGGGIRWEQKNSGKWARMEKELKGLPTNWTKLTSKQIVLDYQQFVFQNYKQGNITDQEIQGFMNLWDIDTSQNMSPTPINCFVYMIIGKDENDSSVYMLDKDNDYDFSDETIQFPVDYSRITDSLVQPTSHNIDFEYVNKGQLFHKKVPVLIFQSNNFLNYSFPMHYQFTSNDKKFSLNSGFLHFSFKDNNTYLKTQDGIIQEGEYIKIDEEIYKNLGANFRNMTISLEKMPTDSKLYSSQVGYFALPFKGKAFNADTIINLRNYKGKYVFLDFWGSWCKGCINEIENLKSAYKNLSADKIVFIGIAKDRPNSLTAAIDKYGINWPQILSTNNNELTKLYNIGGFPTTFLIDEKGKIVAKNFRGGNLQEQIEQYIE